MSNITLKSISKKQNEIVYRFNIPDEIKIDSDGRKVYHDRFGEGTIFAYTIAFKNTIIPLSYPGNFEKNSITIIKEKEDVR